MPIWSGWQTVQDYNLKQFRMDSMNFLNKKYSSVHNVTTLTQSRSRSSRNLGSFHQLGHHPNQRDSPSLSQTASLNNSIASNHCHIHPQELIRHLCLDCTELLCSECIGEHISVHKENNSFPNIQTLKQVKTEMNVKLAEITDYMFKQKNHPKNMASSVDAIRKESLDKIDALRKNLIELVEQWIMRLKTSIMNNVGYEEVKLIQHEMYGLHEEVNQLINSLALTNASVHDLKRAFQIDAGRLQKTYTQMMEKYLGLSDSMRIDIELETNKFIQGLQSSIALRVGGKSKQENIKVDEDQSEIIEPEEAHNMYEQERMNLPLQIPHKDKAQSLQLDNVPLLFSLVSGTENLKIIDPSKKKLEVNGFRLQGVTCYPLNSVGLLHDGMVIVSGGMISENKKSDLIQVYDYEQGILVNQYKMSRGRSSHRTLVHEDMVMLIGGFTSQNEECRDVEILTVEGVKTAQHKCKWGGPNLCLKTKNNKIVKITVSGMETMDLNTMKWEEVTTEVPFALSKGMQICNYIDQQHNEVIVVFGDDEYFYVWDWTRKQFEKILSNLTCPVISATRWENSIYGWVEDSKITVVKLESNKWEVLSSK